MTPYFDLNTDQFEQIVVAIGQHLFGAGLMGFASGKDGGRDAKFIGTAQEYPSRASPWKGCTIIQAKHTSSIGASFSDADVFRPGKATGLILDETSKISALYKSGEAQNYLLISNRSLTAITHQRLTEFISSEAGIPIENVALAGTKQIDNWLGLFPQAKSSISINPLESPLIVDPNDLASTIEGFREALDVGFSEGDDSKPTPRTSLVDKNRLNNMTGEFEATLRKYYLKHTSNIRMFLSDPINDDHRASYQEAVEEFNLKIIEKRGDYDTFDQVFGYLTKLLVDRSSILASNKALTRAMLYYMYYNCDIGRDNDD